MQLEDYIINDLKPIDIKEKVGDLQQAFNQLTYSHIPVSGEGVYLGCISETDAHCFDSEESIEQIKHAAEAFFVRSTSIWLDVLETFARNNSNIMPVLDATTNQYLGYYELNDLIHLFQETHFLSEPGGIVIVEKGLNDYSFSEIAQIVESNNAKLLGSFISKMDSDLVQITVKIGGSSINDVLQTFRRYSYEIISGHEQDGYLESLKDRSNYLNKYLNI
jgi:hypothetical protein